MATTMALGMARLTPPVEPKSETPSRFWSRPGKLLMIGGLVFAAILTLWRGALTMTAATTPVLALQLDPGNARANAEKAEQALARSDIRIAALAARRALMRSAAVPSAARTLGLASSLDGRPDKALAAMRYADRLSRRDLGTNLWFIEYAIARNDVGAALNSYDTALRSSGNAAALLFPILARTLDDHEYVAPLTEVLSNKPFWTRQFLEHIFNVNVPPVHLARLAQAMAKSGAPFDADLHVTLINRLVQAQEYDVAWALYVDRLPEAAKTQAGFRSPGADATATATATATAFDWQYINSADATAYARKTDRSIVFRSFSPDDVTLASQLLQLEPGRYAISSRTQVLSGQAAPYWVLSCAATNRTLGRAAADALMPSSGNTIDVTCSAQWLRLMLPETSNALTEGSVGSIGLVAIGSKALR